MDARVLEGAPVADAIRQDVEREVQALGQAPRLVAVLAGDNPGARAYARSQQAACDEVGIAYELRELGANCSQRELTDHVASLNADPSVSAAILMMPVPPGVDARAVQQTIRPDKDAEGMHPANVGRLLYGDFSLAPCTPHAVVAMLEHAAVDLNGAEVVVVGHSEIVGKPLVVMLLRSANAAPTVTCCHIATRNLASHTRRAHVLIVAAGKPGLITGEMVAEGAVVVDVGINRVKDPATGKSRIVGDVDFEAVRRRASVITPVPGGVGVVTTAMLLRNVLECARRQARR